MKNHMPKTINNQLNRFYKEMLKLAKKYAPSYILKRSANTQIESVHEQLANAVYSNEEGTRKGSSLIRAVKEACEKCGLEFAGAGRTRIAVTTTYYSKKIAIKLCIADGSNDQELDIAKDISSDKSNRSKSFKQCILTPSHHWKNDKWGTVIAFPYAPIINGGDWNIGAVKRQEWDMAKVPKNLQTKKFARRVIRICKTYYDIHPWNIGVMGTKAYLIDYE